MRPILELTPTQNQNFRIIGFGERGNLEARLRSSRRAEEAGDFERACEIRYDAFQDIVEIMPDDEQSVVELDRNHPNTLAAMEIILASAVDNYLLGDGELAAAQVEMLLDCDSEDPLEATPLLALCYVTIAEWECLEDIDGDLGDKSAVRPLVRAISEFVCDEVISDATVAELKRFREFCQELKLSAHPTDDAYLQDITSEHPTKAAQARELYLRAEPAINRFPEFLPALQRLL